MDLLQNKICKLCGSTNSSKVLLDRTDKEYAIPTKVDYWKCNNENCGLVYVSPIPSKYELSQFYTKYTTHNSNLEILKFHLIGNFIRYKRKKYLNSLFVGLTETTLKILDFGCGNGNLLKELKEIGIQKLYGYDIDAVACSVAKKQGFDAFSDKEIIDLNAPYDFIFLNHVIEHLAEPSKTIEELSQYLSENGRIIVRTPNSNSFLANYFGDNWRGWETPRHLNIFNSKNISILFKNFTIEENYTSNLMFSGIFNESFHSHFYRNTIFGKIIRKIQLMVFWSFAIIINYIFPSKGEELCVVAKKK